MSNIIHFLIIFLSLLFIDSFYLSLIGSSFSRMIFAIQKSNIELHLLSAIFCYIFLSLAILIFIKPEKNQIQRAFLLGLIIYGVYESTSYALIKNWSLQIAVIDTIWGGILFVLATLLSKYLMENTVIANIFS